MDTLFGLNIIVKAIFTVRGRTRMYAWAPVPYEEAEEALAIPSPFLTDTSKKLHQDEVFLLRGRDGGSISPLTEALVAHAAAS